MLSPHRSRDRLLCQVVLALPLAVLVGLVASGRLQEFWRVFQDPARVSSTAFDQVFATALIWTLSSLPLMLTAWRLGRNHTAARRLNYEMLVGVREVLRVALGREQSPAQAEAFVRPPRDRVGVALLMGVGVAVMVPVFFMSFAPPLRTVGGAIWLGGAGLLMGGMAYCSRRASAYLLEEPRYFDLFRQWRLLNPNRYEAPARPFVRAQVVCAVLLPIWWLGGGAMIIG